VQQRLPWLHAFWKFSRPHTIIGTSLSVLGLYLIATGPDLVALSSTLPALLLALLACLSGNIYIVGLNQLEDVAIDRINKPTLPLASGEFSQRMGLGIVTIAGILALVISLSQGWFLFATVGLSLLIGTAYSLPPIRLKRFPFWASLCILVVRGAIVNLGLFLHFHQLHPRFPEVIPPAVWALTLFVLGFTFAIAIFKDIPDMEGDRQYNIATLTLSMGAASVFNLARGVLTISYLSMIVAGAVGLPTVNSGLLVISHSVALALLWFWSLRVDVQDQAAIAQFYQFIWKLFFLEYLLFPAACLWG